MRDRKKKRIYGFFLLSFFLGWFSLFPVSVYARPSEDRVMKLKSMVQPYLDTIDKYYYESVDTNQLFEAVIQSANNNTTAETVLRDLIEKLDDPYTDFFTEEELNQFQTSMKGSFYGIGVSVTKTKSGAIEIKEVFNHSPAKEEGLKKGDLIYQVAGKDVTNMKLQDVIKLIKGKEGTKVQIRVTRKKENKVFLVERREVLVPSVKAKFYKKSRIGYIQVAEFLDNTDEEFIEKIAMLTKRKMSSLIIDLRNNGGGYVDTAHNMLERILPNNKIVYSYRYKNNLSQVFRTGLDSRKDEILALPIVVLTNKYSASASEIFSGALKDHGVAEIVGEKTFGKGVAQTIFEHRSGELKGAIKITVLHYLLPNGESIHKTGILPDYQVVNKKNKKGVYMDLQLEQAIQLLKKKK